MKKLYFLFSFLIVTVTSFGQNTGDIAIIGVNVDGSDDIAIVALADIPANSTIYISDNELDGSGGFVDTNEGELTWETGVSVISAGSVVVFTDISLGTSSTVSVGSITAGSNFNLGASGDAAFFYLGSDPNTPTTFLAGIQNSTSSSVYGDLTGSGLTIGSTFVIFTTSGTPDGGAYSGSRDSQTSFTDYLGLIGNSGNWTTESSDGELILPFDTTAFTESAVATPIITISGSVSSFFYYEGNGPSSEDMFSVSGSNLTQNIAVTAPTNFEVSLTSGSGFGSSVTVTQSGGTAGPTDIYVRLAASLTANSYSGDVTASSTGATDATLALSGLVSPADPVISTSGSIADLEYVDGSGPSVSDSFTVSALFLTADLVVTAPTDFEVSLSSGSGFANSLNITPDGSGTVNDTEIFVRLKSGLTIGNYTGNVEVSSTNATTRTEFANGDVYPAATCVNVGDVIITEIMQNPSAVGDTSGEYFEVYNTTGSAIDMLGWIISDAGSDSHTIGSSVVVPANGYAVLGINSDSGTNGGVTVDYQYSSFSLANGDDEVILSCSSTVIDEVAYDGGPNFPDPSGASMELSTIAYSNTDNDSGANWGEATSEITSGGDLGTPGAINTLSSNSFDKVQFGVYPNPTSTGFVTIKSINTNAINAKVFDILGKQVLDSNVVSGQLNVSSLKSGVYILKLTQDNATTTKKLVIQ